ncbi:MAG: hypothetical protein RSB67_01580 [Clostridia bacterium]
MNKKNVIITISIVIIILILTFLGFFITNKLTQKKLNIKNNSIEEKHDEKVISKEEKNKPQSVVISSKIGMDLIQKAQVSNMYSRPIYDELKKSGLSNDYIIMLSIDKAFKNAEYSYMLKMEEKYFGNIITGSDLLKVAKDYFGVNVKIDNKEVYLSNYNSTDNNYTIIPIGFGGEDFEYVIDIPYYIEEDENKAYLFVYQVFVVGYSYVDFTSQDNKASIYYDDSKKDKIKNIEDERIFNEDYQSDLINELILNSTIDKTKLSKAKYTFNKENKNYFISKYEVI